MYYGLIMRVKSNGKIRKFGVLNQYGNTLQMTHSELLKHVRKGEVVNLAPNGDYFTGKGCSITEIPLFDENMVQISGMQYDAYFNILANEIHAQAIKSEIKQLENEQSKQQDKVDQTYKSMPQPESSNGSSDSIDDYLSVGLDKLGKLGSMAKKEATKRLNREKYLEYLERVEKLLDFMERIGESCIRSKLATNERLRRSGETLYNRQMDATTSDPKINEYILRYGIMEVRNRMGAFYSQARSIIENELTANDRAFYINRLQVYKKHIHQIKELHKETSYILKENVKIKEDLEAQERQLKEQEEEQRRLEKEQQEERERIEKENEKKFKETCSKYKEKLHKLESDIRDVKLTSGDSGLDKLKNIEDSIDSLFSEAQQEDGVADVIQVNVASAMTLLEDRRAGIEEKQSQAESERLAELQRQIEEEMKQEEERHQVELKKELKHYTGIFNSLKDKVDKADTHAELNAIRAEIEDIVEQTIDSEIHEDIIELNNKLKSTIENKSLKITARLQREERERQRKLEEEHIEDVKSTIKELKHKRFEIKDNLNMEAISNNKDEYIKELNVLMANFDNIEDQELAMSIEPEFKARCIELISDIESKYENYQIREQERLRKEEEKAQFKQWVQETVETINNKEPATSEEELSNALREIYSICVYDHKSALNNDDIDSAIDRYKEKSKVEITKVKEEYKKQKELELKEKIISAVNEIKSTPIVGNRREMDDNEDRLIKSIGNDLMDEKEVKRALHDYIESCKKLIEKNSKADLEIESKIIKNIHTCMDRIENRLKENNIDEAISILEQFRANNQNIFDNQTFYDYNIANGCRERYHRFVEEAVDKIKAVKQKIALKNGQIKVEIPTLSEVIEVFESNLDNESKNNILSLPYKQLLKYIRQELQNIGGVE